MTDDGSETVQIGVQIAPPQLDAFQRQNPPGATSDVDLWSFAATFIDFGNALLAYHNNVRAEHAARDIVMAALLRRALITAESIFNLLYHGLPEGAIVLLRTLLDIELNAKLIHADGSDKTAKRLAAYHYFAGKRHGEKMATDKKTRDMIQRYEGAFAEHLDTVRRYKGWFEAPGFEEVRKEITPGRPWHGYTSVESAFEAVDSNTDYHQTYDTGTFFVHSTNVEYDFDDIVNGRVMLKAPLTVAEDRLLSVLGTCLGHLHSVMEIFASDKPIRQEQGWLTVNGKNHEPIGAVDAAGIILGQVLSKYSSRLDEDAKQDH